MTREQFYLLKLIEECQEVSQRASKSMQFGSLEKQNGQNETNAERLRGEVEEDLLTVIQVLELETNQIASISLQERHLRRRIKTEKLRKYMKYSQELGEVQ